METMLAILILAVVRLAVPFAALMIIGTVVQRHLKATNPRLISGCPISAGSILAHGLID